MQDLVLNIDNKEVFNEILHHSIDYLIGSSKQKNASITKSSHKFGFSDPEEFKNAVKFISNIFRQYVLELLTEAELLAHFSHFNSDFQQSVLDVLTVRRLEVEEFLLNELNSQTNDLLMSFDWDLRWIMGTNNLASLRGQIATLILNCKTKNSSELKTIYMEMNRKNVDKLIEILEECDEKLSAVES